MEISSDILSNATNDLWLDHHSQLLKFTSKPYLISSYTKELEEFTKKRSQSVKLLGEDPKNYPYAEAFKEEWADKLKQKMNVIWKKKLSYFYKFSNYLLNPPERLLEKISRRFNMKRELNDSKRKRLSSSRSCSSSRSPSRTPPSKSRKRCHSRSTSRSTSRSSHSSDSSFLSSRSQSREPSNPRSQNSHRKSQRKKIKKGSHRSFRDNSRRSSSLSSTSSSCDSTSDSQSLSGSSTDYFAGPSSQSRSLSRTKSGTRSKTKTRSQLKANLRSRSRTRSHSQSSTKSRSCLKTRSRSRSKTRSRSRGKSRSRLKASPKSHSRAKSNSLDKRCDYEQENDEKSLPPPLKSKSTSHSELGPSRDDELKLLYSLKNSLIEELEDDFVRIKKEAVESSKNKEFNSVSKFELKDTQNTKPQDHSLITAKDEQSDSQAGPFSSINFPSLKEMRASPPLKAKAKNILQFPLEELIPQGAHASPKKFGRFALKSEKAPSSPNGFAVANNTLNDIDEAISLLLAQEQDNAQPAQERPNLPTHFVPRPSPLKDGGFFESSKAIEEDFTVASPTLKQSAFFRSDFNSGLTPIPQKTLSEPFILELVSSLILSRNELGSLSYLSELLQDLIKEKLNKNEDLSDLLSREDFLLAIGLVQDKLCSPPLLQTPISELKPRTECFDALFKHYSGTQMPRFMYGLDLKALHEVTQSLPREDAIVFIRTLIKVENLANCPDVCDSVYEFLRNYYK